MAKPSNKVIITCAVTGAIHTPMVEAATKELGMTMAMYDQGPGLGQPEDIANLAMTVAASREDIEALTKTAESNGCMDDD